MRWLLASLRLGSRSNAEERQGEGLRAPLLFPCPGGSGSDSPPDGSRGGSPRSLSLAEAPSDEAHTADGVHSGIATPLRHNSPNTSPASSPPSSFSHKPSPPEGRQSMVCDLEARFQAENTKPIKPRSSEEETTGIDSPKETIGIAPPPQPVTTADAPEASLHAEHSGQHPAYAHPAYAVPLYAASLVNSLAKQGLQATGRAAKHPLDATKHTLNAVKKGVESAVSWINPLPYFNKKRPTAVAMQEIVVLSESPEREEERFVKAIKDLMDQMNDASPLDYEKIFCGCFPKHIRVTKSFQRLLASLKWGSRISIVLPYAAFAGFSVGMQNILPLRAINDVRTPTGGAVPLDDVSYVSYCTFMVSLAALSCSAWASTYGSRKIIKLISGTLMSIFGGIEQALYTYSAAGFFRSLQKDRPLVSDAVRIAVGLSAITLFVVHVGFNLKKLFRYHSSSIHPDIQELNNEVPFKYIKFLTAARFRKMKSAGHYIAYFIFRNVSPLVVLLGIYNLFSQRIENLRYAHAMDGLPYDTETPLMIAQICLALFATVLLLPRTKKTEPLQKFFFYVAQYAAWTLRTIGALSGLHRIIYSPEPTPEFIVQFTGEPSFLYSIPLVKMYSNFYNTPGKQVLFHYFYKEKNKKDNSPSTSRKQSLFSPKDLVPFQSPQHCAQPSLAFSQ